MKRLKNYKGITLIALVVTIVVLLILALISISLLGGENGIINKAQQAKEESVIAEEKDAISLAYNAAKIKKMGGIVNAEDIKEQFAINGTIATATDSTNIIIIEFTETNRIYTINEQGKITDPTSAEIEVPQNYEYSFKAGNNIMGYVVETGDKDEEENLLYEILFIGKGEMYEICEWNTDIMEVSIFEGRWFLRKI